ncbi:MAG: hypothetical protein COA93_08515 [Alphaproteobacteria bacterium]|nr:MAG: hypothetical protein COA93_08515 [Alphaproteobacteria bacterium]
MSFFIRVTIKTIISAVMSLACLTSLSLAYSGNNEQADYQIFNEYDINSKVTINYGNWTRFLKATVVRARMSSRNYAKQIKTATGTRINFSNQNPSRLEASRILFHLMKKQDLEYIRALRIAMEHIPQITPLKYLNRNEQLAYWLNLYNITLYDQIAHRYPIKKLHKLRKGRGNTPSMWDEKLLNINGMQLSLNDIQYNIIQKIWSDPLVLYGMYHGTIGGPNITVKAFTGKNVYNLLETNAEEFINSLRGLRFRGKTALVSKMYQWNQAFFPDFETDMRRHLRKYTNYQLTMRLDTSHRIKTTSYDWHITDVINSRVAMAGSHISKNPVAMVMSGGSSGIAHASATWDSSIHNLHIHANTAHFLNDFLKYNSKNVKTTVTVEEIERKDIEEQ